MTLVLVNPDTKHILSADSDHAILLGSSGDELDRCILIVPREAYFAALSAWLDRKSDYRDRYSGDFCGVGDILWNDAALQSDRSYHFFDHEFNDDDETVTTKKVDSPCYRATSFEIDMEHG